MSYILDALKKSEQERPPGPVPDLFTVQGPQPPAPRRPTRAIAAAGLLVTLAALSLFVWFGRETRREQGASGAQLAASQQPAARVTASPAAQADPVLEPEPVPVPVQAAEPYLQPPVRMPALARRPVEERRHSAAPAAPKPQSDPAPAAAQTIVPTSPGVQASAALLAPPSALPPVFVPPAPAAAAPEPLPAAAAVIPPIPAAASPSGASPVAAPATVPETAPAPNDEPPADGRVLALAELPGPVRSQLPKMVVSAHVWSEESSLRLLSVDDRLLHEGGEAAPGVTLQEITPSGAIFTFKGWRFRVAGARQ